VKPAINRALAVGALGAVTLGVFLFALTFFRKGGYSEKDSYLVHAYFSDATGLTWKSRAQIAGIQVGEVVDIALEGNKARLDIRVKNGIELHTDACLTKTFPSALLPDALLEVQPGSTSKPLLASLPEPERRITCVREATSVQQLLDAMSKIAADVSTVTGDLAETVTGKKGLRQILENLASASARIDQAIAANEQNLNQIMRNARDFSADLREISGRDKAKIGRIFDNVEDLTAKLRVVAASLEDIIDPGRLAPGAGGAAGAPGTASGAGAAGRAAAAGAGSSPQAGAPGAPPQTAVGAALAQATPQERSAAAEQARGVRQAVEKLTSSLERLEAILAKVNEGKSVAGRLLVDERLGRKAGDAIEGLSDQLDRIFKLQVQVELRSEWLLNQSGAKTFFGLKLLPRPDKFYLLEIVSDPRGVDSVRTDTVTTCNAAACPPGAESTQTTTTATHDQNKLTFSLEFGKRYGPVTLRGGIIESSGGVGSDLHLFKDTLQLSVSIYQFSRPTTAEARWPRAKIWLNWYAIQHLYATVGADDFLNNWKQGHYPGGSKFAVGNDTFFGAGIYFTDDDLKTLLGAGAGSAASSVGTSR
jgi:phospholipid/cholesterol/gamma-HCH transport system substrate-binding protein